MTSKKITDASSYSRQTLEEIRIDAVRQIGAESPEDVIAGLGMNRHTIERRLVAYHCGAEERLQAKPIVGAPPKMAARQMAEP